MYRKIRQRIKIGQRIVLSLTLMMALGFMSCSSQDNKAKQLDSTIQWSDLRITPPPSGTFCWNTSIMGGKALSWDKFKENFQDGLAVGMSEVDISGAHQIGYQTFGVMSSQLITANFHLWYPIGNKKSAKIRFFALLDEKQLTNAFDSGGNYTMLVNSGDDITIKLHLPALTIGIHDFIVIGIPYVDDYPIPEGIVKFFGHRITLIAGIPNTSFRPIIFSDLSAEGLLSKNDPQIPLSLILTKNSLIAWNSPEKWLSISSNKSTKFFILAGYEDTTNTDAENLAQLDTSFFVLLSLIDYQQENISFGKSVIYGKVSKDTAYASIPAEIAPLPFGTHHILFLRINSPGIPICLMQDTIDGRILPFNISASLVGIDVISK